MGLRKKTFVIIVSICLVLIVSLMLSSRLLILNGFRNLETEHVQQDVAQASPVVTIPQDNDIISGYMVQNDIQQDKGFILKTDVRRKIFNQGMNTWLYFNIAVVFIGMVFILATMYLMETSVLSPLLKLIGTIGTIGGKDHLSKRLPVSGKDELGKLAASINGMLDRIQTARNEIKILEGLIPICSYCKNIRDDEGFWQKVDHYIHHHTHARFSHGICPECAKKYFPELDLYEQPEKGEPT